MRVCASLSHSLSLSLLSRSLFHSDVPLFLSLSLSLPLSLSLSLSPSLSISLSLSHSLTYPHTHTHTRSLFLSFPRFFLRDFRVTFQRTMPPTLNESKYDAKKASPTTLVARGDPKFSEFIAPRGDLAVRVQH